MQAITAGVDCPLIRQRATAELSRYELDARLRRRHLLLGARHGSRRALS